MTSILKATRLDFDAFKSNYKAFALIYALSVYLSFYTQPAIVIVVVMIFSSVFSGMLFLVYEKNHLGKLYGILPLTRSSAVIGRYLHALLFGAVNLALSGAGTALVWLTVGKGGMDAFAFTAYLSVFFFYFCFSVGVSFPIYYRFGVLRSAISMILPLYLLVMTGIFISRNADSVESLKQIILYLTNHPAAMPVSGVALGCLLLAASCFLSCRIHQKSPL